MGIKIIDFRVDLRDLYRLLKSGSYLDDFNPGFFNRGNPPIYEAEFRGSLKVKVWYTGRAYVSAGEESGESEVETFAASVSGILDPDGRPIAPLGNVWGIHWFTEKDDLLKTIRKEILSIADTEGLNVVFF